MLNAHEGNLLKSDCNQVRERAQTRPPTTLLAHAAGLIASLPRRNQRFSLLQRSFREWPKLDRIDMRQRTGIDYMKQYLEDPSMQPGDAPRSSSFGEDDFLISASIKDPRWRQTI